MPAQGRRRTSPRIVYPDFSRLAPAVKPANIFLTLTDDVKIGDFGLSKALAASNMQANTRVGSPLYMSPELCQGRPYDRGADIWALGCTFYQVCSLRPPWIDVAGKGMMGLARTICTKPLDLQSLRTGYSFELCSLIADLVSKESSARPALREVLTMAVVQNSPLFRQMVAAGDAPTAAPSRPRVAEATASRSDALAAAKPGDTEAGKAEPPTEVALGADAHAAATMLQRSFLRHTSRGRGQLLARQPLGLPQQRVPMAPTGPPTGYSAAVRRANGHNLTPPSSSRPQQRGSPIPR